MAVAFNVASNTKGTATSSLTWAHTCTGTNMLLWVGVGSGANTAHLTSSVTYNAVAMTAELFDLASGITHCSGHYLKNPDTGGAFNIIATLAAADDEMIVGAMSYTDVDQTTPVGTPNSASSTTVNITSATGELVVDAQYTADWTAPQNHAATGGQTERVNVTDSGDAFGFLGMSEHAGAASVTMSWTTDATGHQIGGVSLKPVAASTPDMPGQYAMFPKATMRQPLTAGRTN